MTATTKKETPTMEHVFHQTAITKKRCRCWGCGRQFPAGTRMRCFAAFKKGAGHVRLHYCQLCRELAWDLTNDEWVQLQYNALRRGRPDEWAAIYKKQNPSEEVDGESAREH